MSAIMMRSTFLQSIALAAGVALLFAAPVPRALAADGSWNVDANGNWSTTGSWLGGTIPGSTSLTDSADVATFGFTLTTGRAVTVDANRNIGGITFSNTSAFGYTLSGGSLLLSTGGVIQTAESNGAHTDTISSAIAIQGVGGTGTFTAGATSASGLLSIGAVTGVSTASNTTTLTLNGNNTGANAVTGIIGNGSAGGTLAVVKSGSGQWRLSGVNTFSGGVTLNDGTLSLGANAALGTGTFTIAGGSINVTAALLTTNTQNWNGDFTFVGSNTLNLGTGAVAMNSSRTVTVNASTLTVGGVISGAGFGLTKAGAGVLSLGGANTFTGGVTINSGTLRVTSAIGNGGVAGPLGAATSDAANLMINGGTLELNYSSANTTSDRGITFGTNGGTIYGNGTYGAAAIALNGPVVLQGNGARTITLRANASNRVYTLAGNFADAGGATSIVTAAGPNAGTSSWRLNGSVTMTGGLTVGDGTVLKVTGTTLSSYGGGLSIGAGAQFSVRTSGTVATNITNNGRINAESGSPNVVYAGVISGTGQFSPTAGNNTTELRNTTNSYTGITAINGSPAGTLRVVKLANGGQNSSVGASSNAASNLQILNSVLFYLGGGDSTDRLFTVGGFNGTVANIGEIVASGSGAIDFTNTGAMVWANAGQTGLLTLSGTNTANNSLAPVISDNGVSLVSLTKTGDGTWVLAGNNTFSGTTKIGRGRLSVATVGNTGSSSNLGANGTINFGSTTTTGTLIYTGVGETSDKVVNLAGTTGGGGIQADNASGTLIFSNNLTVTGSGAKTLTLSGSGAGQLQGIIPNYTGAGGPLAVSVTKSGNGIWTLSGANTYTGNTAVNNGVLQLSSTAAITGAAARPYTVNAGGALAAGFALDQPLLDKVVTTSAGVIALAAGGTNSTALNFSSLTAASLGAVGTGTQAYTGTLTPSGTVYRLGGGGGTLDFQSLLTGGRALIVGGSAAGLGGMVILSGTDNSFTGKTTISSGTVLISSLTNVSGGNSSLGAPTSPANGTIDLGSETASATLRYLGSGDTSDRVLNLAGTTGGITLDAAGSGPLVLTAANTATGAGTKTFTLTGSNTGNNSIGAIAGSGVSVAKTGPGLWRLTGLSTYDGQLTVSDGTIVVGTAVGGGVSPFGTATSDNLLPIIGSSAANLTGTAALLADDVTISRGFSVATLGVGSSQVAVIGNAGSGTATFAAASSIRLGRDVTLQAATGGEVVFAGTWRDAAGGTAPAVALTVGSAGNAGTVVLGSFLPDAITAVNVRRGTLRLSGGTETIGFGTPVTLGEAGFGGTLDVNGITQPLASLSFAGVGSTATGAGTLRLFNSGSAAAMNVAGTGHTIATALALDDAASFNVAAGGRLGISGVIATGSTGARSLTKTGLGILELAGQNTYSGDTTVSAGTLVLNGSLGAGALSVASGATLMGSGTIGGIATIFGTHSPGNSPGIETFSSDLSYSGGASQVVWELWGNTTTQGTPTAIYDQIVVGGNLDFTGGTSLSLSFGGSGVGAVDWDDTFWDTPQTWTLFDVGGATTGFGNLTLANDPSSWLDASGDAFSASSRSANSFSVAQQGSDLVVQYVVVPEPGALALAGLGLAAVACAVRRRR